MKILGIDDEKCIKCLKCVKECEPGLFQKLPTEIGEKRKIIYEDPFGRCNSCGHCISVCETDAILHENGDDPMEFEGIKNPESLISYEKLMKVLRSRRSIRQYKDKMVPKEGIEAILEAMRYAPSASNAQNWRYTVLTDPKKINDFRMNVVSMMKKLRKALGLALKLKFLLPKSLKDYISRPSTKANLDGFLARTENGEDRVFYNAPVVIITHAQVYGSKTMTGADAGIALTHGMLAAQALGLGTCWIGISQEALNRFGKNKKALNIPKKEVVNGVLILGYPAVKFQRAPPREPLKVSWDLN